MDFLSGPEESRGGAAGPLPVRPLALQEGFEELWMMSEDDVEARPPAMLVQGNFSLPLGEVTTLFGDGGTGKSLVAQDLSIAVAMGQPFLGSQVKSGIVLYLDFEQHKNVALRRFGRLLRGRNLAPSDLKDRLFYRNFSTSGVSMKDLGTLIRQMLADYAPSLVIVDGRQLAYGGDQVDGAVVTEVNKHLKWLTNNGTATVLELDHPSSGSKRAHEVGGNRFKRQHSRAQWELTADAKDRDKLTLTLRKENDGLSGHPSRFGG
jgi:RecA-family ATPase